MHTTAPTPTPTPGRSSVGQAVDLLTEADVDLATRKARLQGWRDNDLDAALAAAPIAHRVGPIGCGLMALATAATGSMALLALTLATAMVGIVASNHPLELAYNIVARRRVLVPLPANRAAKRLGCFVGSIHLVVAAVALTLGAPAVATVSLVVLGVLALFVGTTGICVPSVLYTVLFGAERGTRARIFA